MKALLPSLREKKRYLVFKLIGNQVNARTAKNEIYKNLLNFLGELGISRANIKIIDNCLKTDKGIIKVNVKYLNDLKMGLGLIKTLNDKDVIVDVIGVSGILKKAKQKFMEE